MTNEDFLIHVGIEFKVARVRKNLSRPQLSEKTGISVAAIEAVENGKKDCHILTYKRMYDALEMDMTAFV
jgi:transcriptional regulator with XRE-family HTH domain